MGGECTFRTRFHPGQRVWVEGWDVDAVGSVFSVTINRHGIQSYVVEDGVGYQWSVDSVHLHPARDDREAAHEAKQVRREARDKERGRKTR